MMDEENEEKRKPGRPSKPMPPRIDASPEEVVRMLVTPPKTEEDWRYLKNRPGR